MMKSSTKSRIGSALLFVLGVIVTIIITKASDKISPNDPVIVKQYTDTIKILHNFNIPEDLNNDSSRKELERKVRNLELLNNYDKQIKERIAINKAENQFAPNLIITKDLGDSRMQGFTQGGSSSYFSADCPKLDSKFLDIYIDFLNPDITKDIAYLRVNIYRFNKPDSKDASTYVLEDFYEVKRQNNVIRINNDFSSGKYEILYGFVFKKDLNAKYPTFYLKKCVTSVPLKLGRIKNQINLAH